MGVRKKGRKKRTPLQRPVKEIEGIYCPNHGEEHSAMDIQIPVMS